MDIVLTIKFERSATRYWKCALLINPSRFQFGIISEMFSWQHCWLELFILNQDNYNTFATFIYSLSSFCVTSKYGFDSLYWLNHYCAYHNYVQYIVREYAFGWICLCYPDAQAGSDQSIAGSFLHLIHCGLYWKRISATEHKNLQTQKTYDFVTTCGCLWYWIPQ